jgi:hypothetical protein
MLTPLQSMSKGLPLSLSLPESSTGASGMPEQPGSTASVMRTPYTAGRMHATWH